MTLVTSIFNSVLAKRVGSYDQLPANKLREVNTFMFGTVMFIVVASAMILTGAHDTLRVFFGPVAPIWFYWVLTVAVTRVVNGCSQQLLFAGLAWGVVSTLSLTAVSAFYEPHLQLGILLNSFVLLFLSTSQATSLVFLWALLFIPGWVFNNNPVALIYKVMCELVPGTRYATRIDRMGSRRGKGRTKKVTAVQIKNLGNIRDLINTKRPLITDILQADAHRDTLIVMRLVLGELPSAVGALMPAVANGLGWNEKRVKFIPMYVAGHCAFAYPKDNVAPVKPETMTRGSLALPIAIDLHGRFIRVDVGTNPHILIPGTTGSGKTTTMHAVLYYIAASKVKCKLYFLDPKTTGFSAFKTYADEYATDAGDILRILTNITALLQQRKSNADREHVFVFIDEFASLMDKVHLGSDIVDKIRSRVSLLAREAREFNIHLIIAVQDPSKENLPSDVTKNMTTKLLHKVQSANASFHATGVTGLDGNLLGDMGEVKIVFKNGDVQLGQAVYVSKADVTNALRERMHT